MDFHYSFLPKICPHVKINNSVVWNTNKYILWEWKWSHQAHSQTLSKYCKSVIPGYIISSTQIKHRQNIIIYWTCKDYWTWKTIMAHSSICCTAVSTEPSLNLIIQSSLCPGLHINCDSLVFILKNPKIFWEIKKVPNAVLTNTEIF